MAGQQTKLILGDVRVDVSLAKTSSESSGPRVEVVQLDTSTGRPVLAGTATEITSGLTATGGATAPEPVAITDGMGSPPEQESAPTSITHPPRPAQRDTVAPVIPQTPEQALTRDVAAGHEPTVRTARGVYTDSGDFVDLTDVLKGIDEYAKLEGLTVAKAIDATAIPRDRVRGSFYLEPQSEIATRVRDLLWTVLSDERRALVVRWTKRTNQALGIIVASKAHDALVLLEVEWGPNMRRPSKRAQRTVGFTPSEAELAAARDFLKRHEAPASTIDTLADERRVLRLRAIEQAKTDGTLIELPQREADDEALAKALAEVSS